MLAPFAPHFAEECWERLGRTSSVFEARWPAWDERLVVADQVELPVQVNGKTRSKVQVSRGSTEGTVSPPRWPMPPCNGSWTGKRSGR